MTEDEVQAIANLQVQVNRLADRMEVKFDNLDLWLRQQAGELATRATEAEFLAKASEAALADWRQAHGRQILACNERFTEQHGLLEKQAEIITGLRLSWARFMGIMLMSGAVGALSGVSVSKVLGG